jgi:hypothetical protein
MDYPSQEATVKEHSPLWFALGHFIGGVFKANAVYRKMVTSYDIEAAAFKLDPWSPGYAN